MTGAGPFATIAGRRRLVLVLAASLAAAGVVAWMTMPRQEDPRLPDRVGTLVVPFPGADAETVERLVVEPLDEALAEVEEIEFVRFSARRDVAVGVIQQRDEITDTDRAWDEVEDAIAEARRRMPDGVGEPILETEAMRVE